MGRNATLSVVERCSNNSKFWNTMPMRRRSVAACLRGSQAICFAEGEQSACRPATEAPMLSGAAPGRVMRFLRRMLA